MADPVVTDPPAETLVARAQAGDAAAFEALAARFDGFIRAQARRAWRPGLDVDDLAQEGWLGFLRAVRAFRPDGGAFAAFAARAVQRAVAAAAGTPVAPAVSPEAIEGSGAAPAWHGGLPDPAWFTAVEWLDWLADRMATRLTPEERLALLATLHGIATSDIARHLLRSDGVVENLVVRARRKLRRERV